MSAGEHAIRGTFRKDRHGDLPERARVLPMPPAKTLPLSAVPLAVPDDLKPIERAKWIELTTAFSRLRVEHRDALYIYCLLWGDWIEARTRLAATGGPVIKGTGTKMFMENPYVAQARDAMEGLLSMQNGMLFLGTTEGRKVVREMSKLQRFLAGAPR